MADVNPILRRLVALRLSGRDRLTRYERERRRPFRIAALAFAICGAVAFRLGDSLLLGSLCLAGLLVTGVIAESRSPWRGLGALLAVLVAAGLAFWAYLGFGRRAAEVGALYSTPVLVFCAGAAAILLATAWRLNRL